MIKVSRTNGITLAKRRCCEFRQLAKAIKTELPKCFVPELPPKRYPRDFYPRRRSTGANLSLAERRDILQNFLDSFVAQKMYTKEIHKFLSREFEVPVYLKHISKRANKKGKILITAAPSASIIAPGETGAAPDIRESLIEAANINMETLQQQYTTKIDAMEELKDSTAEKSSTQQPSAQGSTASGNESKVLSASRVESVVKIEDIRTGLVEAMTFTVRVTDTKMQANKIVPEIYVTY